MKQEWLNPEMEELEVKMTQDQEPVNWTGPVPDNAVCSPNNPAPWPCNIVGPVYTPRFWVCSSELQGCGVPDDGDHSIPRCQHYVDREGRGMCDLGGVNPPQQS